MILIDLISACTHHVAPSTIQEVVRIESGGNPLALHVNGVGPIHSPDLRSAIRSAEAAIAAGRTVDIGYMQVNNVTAAKLGYSVAQVFEPCINLQAGAAVLELGFADAKRAGASGQDALRRALSIYNTGDPRRGFRNGYVDRYYAGPHSPQRTTSPYTASPVVYRRPAASFPKEQKP